MSTGAQLQTVRTILEKTVAFFSSKGITTSRLDAELLIAEALGMDRLRLYLNMDRPLDEAELARAREMVRRRAAREPVAYILGRREFASRMFEVNPSVLIPRPETELLVEQAESELKRRFPGEGTAFRVLEFGIGSGAIAVTLAANLPGARVIATEVSAEAAETATRNAATLGVSERIDVRIQSDFSQIEGPFHAILSNPPYVDPSTAQALEPDVRDYEPHQALFAEEKGLEWYRFLTAEAGELLVPGGFLLVEIGAGQAGDVKHLAEIAGLRVNSITKDYSGIERIMTIAR